ncbi:hypothetical protein [Proteus hauseri]|uniref:hypothetical protein n=1 Tax=Proteus hauseri TaxID=183417 RepID=UPI0010095E7A|nr:hypothetical protein [Proteus hauseri]QAV23799.1 hypothetical protein PH4a_10805 [Proteus hauseri]
MDGLIKYHTLEKALECKFINDIRKLKDEFTTDLAKDNLKKNYSKLPSEILKKINDMLNDKTKVPKEMSDYEKINFLFSYERINELKVFVKGEINSEHKNIDFDNIINKTFDSVMNIKNKEEIERSNDNFDNVKEDLYLDLTKELFNNLLKNKKIYGEDAFVSQIDNLIKLTSENISKEMLDKENKIINYLDKSFYKNINKGDKGNDLLTRIFKNSSNNINYKWAQDAIILLMSYETFGIYNNETTTYTSNGVRSIGGSGSENIEKTAAENKLSGVFNRLGLDANNLDKSKDEVLRKYFANYFQRV